MNTGPYSSMLVDPVAVIERHSVRRADGIPTISVLVGPIGAGVGTWRRWAAACGRSVVFANQGRFPFADWVRTIAAQSDVPAAAVAYVARRVDRDPAELLAALQTKTPADYDRFWGALPPEVDADWLPTLAALAVRRDSLDEVARALRDLGEQVVPTVLRLVPSAAWPSILSISGSIDDVYAAGRIAATWAMRAPALPVAIVVCARAWDEYLATAPDSRDKALLREGEIAVAGIDAATVRQALIGAGAPENTPALVAPHGADEALLDAAVDTVRATAERPSGPAGDDRARSAAERFLFRFLESLPETAGRFALNANLDFGFGPRPAEVDLLCRSPRVAIELDGYFHFLGPDDYRRDRAKDWELQRRGFLVLRFLAEDVIPQLETVRDRILDALAHRPSGAQP